MKRLMVIAIALLLAWPASAHFGFRMLGFGEPVPPLIHLVTSVIDDSIDGGTCTLEFNTAGAASGDVIVVIGGGSESGSAAGDASGWTDFAAAAAGGSSGEEYSAWAGYRVATGDTNDNFTSLSPGGATTACAYVGYVFRFVDTGTVPDATASSTERLDDTTPAAVDITTVTSGAVVIVGVVNGSTDTTITYPNPCNSNPITDTGNDSQDVTTAASWCIVATPAAFDPDSAGEWNIGSTDDGRVFTIALRPGG